MRYIDVSNEDDIKKELGIIAQRIRVEHVYDIRRGY